VSDRRQFIATIPAAAAAFAAFDVEELRASTAPASGTPWDLSWVDKIPKAKYPVVWNAFDVNDGLALDLVKFFLDHYHEIYNTSVAETLPLVVFRKIGTAPAYTDAIWDKYGIGEVEKVNDRTSGAPARSNVFAPAIQALQQRNMIPLVCNVALGFYARKLAAKAGAKPEDVANELRASLLPGATLVPSGIFALTRAQHAGAVYMLGA
jgi:intracellular sulfur oxidation DsrE/DsrF family protein